ncbi:PQQ-dependent sugar dehydrogenase [Rhodocytophaga aerolata]|uniref:PQQ-dependent sugar dehydrogenase n=1 Tax=Rhodocytophaga aerolata TaxID=455078 RepID=A0ABT8RFL1_9BACT|nr:PQQ-dependent sugar dehydrogenase [Rhodocytophaga aerolata]MDO1449963.1 PQQ-dependent sugar dehydrogenase [Rhodocytophaga aerolata]
MKFFVYLSLLVFLLCSGSNTKSPKVTLQEAFPKLTIEMPVEFVSPKDGTNRNFVVAQKGIIHVFPNTAEVSQTEEFLNITEKVVSGGERGLLGLAFHPDFKNNGYFYINYTRGNPLETVISRFQVSKANPTKADPSTELVLLTYQQPYSNHNGGKIAFGKDGYLYISAGDGGSGGDPENRSQNLKELLGKIMRIDVNRKTGNRNYGIPADNPFAGNKDGYREEIYAYGLRNVWRFSFDEQTGKLWAGDVGQNAREEINIIEKGGNYGWKVMEGSVCYNGRNSGKNDDCGKKGLIEPIYEYLHSAGLGQSVTGGFVYRGKQMPQLVGKYIYGDYQSGKIWAITLSANGKAENELIADLEGLVSAFGEDKDGEIYVCSYGEGKILKMQAGI